MFLSIGRGVLVLFVVFDVWSELGEVEIAFDPAPIAFALKVGLEIFLGREYLVIGEQAPNLAILSEFKVRVGTNEPLKFLLFIHYLIITYYIWSKWP